MSIGLLIKLYRPVRKPISALFVVASFKRCNSRPLKFKSTIIYTSMGPLEREPKESLQFWAGFGFWPLPKTTAHSSYCSLNQENKLPKRTISVSSLYLPSSPLSFSPSSEPLEDFFLFCEFRLPLAILVTYISPHT